MFKEPAFQAATEDQQAAATGYADSAFGERPHGGGTDAGKAAIALSRAQMAQGYAHSFKSPPSNAPTITQTNTTTIQVPTSAAASAIAMHQGRINERNARNLQTAVNKAN
jgi:hypothetical protein